MQPNGIAKDVLIEFQDSLTSTILGNPFLNSVKATTDKNKGIINRRSWNAMTPDKKPSTAENFLLKFSRRGKNATSATTTSPVAPVT
jgi:hypothetical protein